MYKEDWLPIYMSVLSIWIVLTVIFMSHVNEVGYLPLIISTIGAFAVLAIILIMMHRSEKRPKK